LAGAEISPRAGIPTILFVVDDRKSPHPLFLHDARGIVDIFVIAAVNALDMTSWLSALILEPLVSRGGDIAVSDHANELSLSPTERHRYLHRASSWRFPETGCRCHPRLAVHDFTDFHSIILHLGFSEGRD
jgi:hypothetical protein